MKGKIHKNKTLNSTLREVSEIAGYLWQKGWAERNAGNISVDVSHQVEFESGFPDSCPFFELPLSFSMLGGKCFLVSGTGKRMRDLARKPKNNLVLVKLNAEASGYWLVPLHEKDDSIMPTSELLAHLGIHQMISSRGSAERVVLHAHVTELIALTHVDEFCDQDTLNGVLWSMHPETIVFVPKGVGFVPYTLPGTPEIAEKTIEVLHMHDVAVWEKHGVFAIGKSAGDAFDKMDIVAKSAHIYFLCKSVDITPKGLSDIQLAELKALTSNF